MLVSWSCLSAASQPRYLVTSDHLRQRHLTYRERFSNPWLSRIRHNTFLSHAVQLTIVNDNQAHVAFEKLPLEIIAPSISFSVYVEQHLEPDLGAPL